jgi:hypothetical protein
LAETLPRAGSPFHWQHSFARRELWYDSVNDPIQNPFGSKHPPGPVKAKMMTSFSSAYQPNSQGTGVYRSAALDNHHIVACTATTRVDVHTKCPNTLCPVPL